jgi:hypothetical protein
MVANGVVPYGNRYRLDRMHYVGRGGDRCYGERCLAVHDCRCNSRHSTVNPSFNRKRLHAHWNDTLRVKRSDGGYKPYASNGWPVVHDRRNGLSISDEGQRYTCDTRRDPPATAPRWDLEHEGVIRPRLAWRVRVPRKLHRNYSEGVCGSSCLAVTRRSAFVNRPIGSSSRTSHFSPSLAMIVTIRP